MDNDSALNKAYRQLHLWPPVHAAVDVFMKRKARAAEPYELAWRLIHVWECIAIFLAEACTSRMMALQDYDNDVRTIREKCYGRSWNQSESSFDRQPSALDGSIDRWIEILEYVSTTEVGTSHFLSTVKTFLNSAENEKGEHTLINIAPLINAWGKACDVPSGIKAAPCAVKGALKIVNSFRNRFAHVPFPYAAIEGVYKTLEKCTENLFSAHPHSGSPLGALCGAIAIDNNLMKGSLTIPNPVPEQTTELSFVHGLSKNSANEVWPTKCFIYVDKMFRPYVLTRLKDAAGLWEYTRYLAESNAVITVGAPEFFDDFPVPSEAEYELPEDTGIENTTPEKKDTGTTPPSQDTQVRSMVDALRAIRERRFREVIQYLESLVEDQPDYHVGWLRLGYARREWAVDLRQEANGKVMPEQRELLELSLNSLNKAKNHVGRQYKAEACYQASKTYYRLWCIEHSDTTLEEALQQTFEASETYPDSKYEPGSNIFRTGKPLIEPPRVFRRQF